MHEFAVATSLVESVTEIAKERSASKVVEVHLKVGKLRVLSIDQLRFSYEILSKGTLLEGSRLSIEETPGFTRCPNCNYTKSMETSDLTFHFLLPKMTCPKCATVLIIEGGDECLITKVRMVIESEPEIANPTKPNECP